MVNLKIREELIACAASLALAVGKSAMATWTGSLALFASALDSLMDFLVSGLNLFSLTVAERPADEDHTYGHGKAEAIAGSLQSLFIFGSALYLLGASLHRFWNRTPLHHLPQGMVLIFISLVASFWLARRLSRTAARTGSLVLKTDSLHYSMDLYTHSGILVSFFLIRATGWEILDPVVTLPVVLYIFYQSFRTGRQAIDELMDREVSPEIKEKVQAIVDRYRPTVVGMHNFKSRHAASKKFLQFHLELKKDLTFEAVHELEERIAGEIRRELGNVQVTIHADPEGHGLDQTDLM